MIECGVKRHDNYKDGYDRMWCITMKKRSLAYRCWFTNKAIITRVKRMLAHEVRGDMFTLLYPRINCLCHLRIIGARLRSPKMYLIRAWSSLSWYQAEVLAYPFASFGAEMHPCLSHPCARFQMAIVRSSVPVVGLLDGYERV
jgi:hypothetical protein